MVRASRNRQRECRWRGGEAVQESAHRRHPVLADRASGAFSKRSRAVSQPECIRPGAVRRGAGAPTDRESAIHTENHAAPDAHRQRQVLKGKPSAAFILIAATFLTVLLLYCSDRKSTRLNSSH